ncbi:hypothetical protein GBA65_16550 [Rubrobacter marinus]|uniref:CN hydrolase domain-containing protein n=1 Tax=Rubrobacter marinus TaxID=2653852 RepID=A0A6G8Q078_9ACTN|nr:carbon-nitrogen hydrolase family protein [Rubrobacter marinus]QIN79871.1 hypothetical protein GBA65_16550 [Rubrobacter marinus]
MGELSRITPVGTARNSSTTLVAALNLGPVPGDVRGNLRLAERELRAAKHAHPDLRCAVLPELFTCAYADLASVHRHAEDARGGPSARFFARLARELDLHVAYGFPERRLDGTADSVNFVGPEGVLATYAKKHLVRETGEHRVFVPGDGPVVVEAGGLGVALAVCWDLGFPEFVREAAARGADLVLAPAGWRDPFGPQYDLACAARVLDNGIYVASANQMGRYPGAIFGSPGGVYGPDGLRVSEAFGDRSVALVDGDLPGRWRRLFGDTLPGRGAARSSNPSRNLGEVAHLREPRHDERAERGARLGYPRPGRWTGWTCGCPTGECRSCPWASGGSAWGWGSCSRWRLVPSSWDGVIGRSSRAASARST